MKCPVLCITRTHPHLPQAFNFSTFYFLNNKLFAKRDGDAAVSGLCPQPWLLQACRHHACLLTSWLHWWCPCDAQKQPMWQTVGIGLFAAAVGPCCNCPMDVVKTRLMAQV